MPFAPQTILWKIVLHQALLAQTVQNVFYFSNINTIDDDDLISETHNALLEFDLVVHANLAACQVTQLSYVKATNTVIIPHSGPFEEIFYAVNDTGLQDGDALPSYVAAVVAKLTGNSGRTNRGRWYFAGLSEAAVFENDLSDFEFDHFVDLITAMGVRWQRPGGSSNRMNHVLYSHHDGDSGGQPTFLGVKQINSLVVRRQVYTQRHRLQGVGT